MTGGYPSSEGLSGIGAPVVEDSGTRGGPCTYLNPGNPLPTYAATADNDFVPRLGPGPGDVSIDDEDRAFVAACRDRLIDANRQRVELCAKVCAVPYWGYDESPGGCLECCIDPKNAQGQDCEYMYRGIGRLSE